MRPLGESSPFCRALSVRHDAFRRKKKKDSGDVIATCVCLEPWEGFAPRRNMTGDDTQVGKMAPDSHPQYLSPLNEANWEKK